jgi:hypothetical protein
MLNSLIKFKYVFIYLVNSNYIYITLLINYIITNNLNSPTDYLFIID